MSRAAEPVSCRRLVDQLRDLGVERGAVLVVHTSFRAVRPVEGGPDGVIAALLDAVGSEGTVVMPSWSGLDDEPFDPKRSPVSPSLGVVARRFTRWPGVRRSDHVHAFAAVGPDADTVLADPLPLPPHEPASPVGRVHELDGSVLLLGVDHDANTTIHLAELLGGALYRRRKSCTVLRDGRPVRIEYGENDHCCDRFRLVGPWLGHVGARAVGSFGHGEAELVRSRDVVDVVTRRLATDPLVFLHAPEVGCEECDDARASVGRVE